MKFKKFLAMALIGTMTLSLVACGSGSSSTEQGQTAQSNSTYDTIVVSSTEFNGIFNPLFYSSAFDSYAFGPVFASVSSLDDNNQLVDNAGNISYKEIKDDAGNTVQAEYTIKLKDGLTFSDGTPVTIDDYIFGLYVKADPAYDGISTFNTLNIDGLKEYYYDSPDYAKKIEEFKTQSENLSEADINAYIEKYTDEQIAKSTPADLNASLGLGINESASDFDKQVRAKLLEINKADEDMPEKAKSAKFEELKKSYINANLSDGVGVTEIKGIKRVDDLTCTVLLNGVNIVADRELATDAILPRHYYGVADDGTKFKKGDMTVPKSRNNAPMGCGPYMFKSFDNNIVSLEANPNYFKGAPKTPNLKFQVVSENNKVDVVAKGEMDISDPSPSKEIMSRLEKESIEYNLTDNNGFGYIGINSERIPDINVRKGLMHLMNREPAIKSYYGDLAEILERPLTSTLAEYPQDAKAYYTYDKAKALEYFEKAGYKKDANGKLVNAKGEQLKVEVGVGDLKNHPTAGIFSQMKNDMEELGAEFIVSDLQFNVLSDRIASGDLDMFALAWSNQNNADLKQIYHSSSANGSGSNYFKLKSPEVDALLDEVATTLDLEKRKELVAKELDLIMENAVIMPIYQRKNLNIFNGESLNMDTVYRSDSPYHTFRDEYHTIEMK